MLSFIALIHFEIDDAAPPAVHIQSSALATRVMVCHISMASPHCPTMNVVRKRSKAMHGHVYVILTPPDQSP